MVITLVPILFSQRIWHHCDLSNIYCLLVIFNQTSNIYDNTRQSS